MLEFNRILLATDFSASASAALQYAARLAHLSHATLQVLHVIDTRVAALRRWTDVFRSTEVLSAKEASGTTALQELLADPALSGLCVETLLRHGHPGDAIIDAAVPADLVVMGIGGTTGEGSNGAGEMARQVAHGSTAPVLLVPASARLPATSQMASSALPVESILLALHVVQYAPQAVVLSEQFAAVCNAALSVLQVLDPLNLHAYPLDTGGGLAHNLEGTRALLGKRLEEIVPDRPTGPAIERLVVDGTPEEVIVREARERRADLLVMSVHAYAGLHKLFTASTVDTVLARTPCPLLAVPILSSR